MEEIINDGKYLFDRHWHKYILLVFHEKKFLEAFGFEIFLECTFYLTKYMCMLSNENCIKMIKC